MKTWTVLLDMLDPEFYRGNVTTRYLLSSNMIIRQVLIWLVIYSVAQRLEKG